MAEMGDTQSAYDCYEKAIEALNHVLDRKKSRLLAFLGMTYYAMGNISESDIYFQELLKNDGEVDNSIQIAEVFAQRGEADQCFVWLERAYERKHPAMCLLKCRGPCKEIRKLGDPRYNDFLVRMNIPVD